MQKNNEYDETESPASWRTDQEEWHRRGPYWRRRSSHPMLSRLLQGRWIVDLRRGGG